MDAEIDEIPVAQLADRYGVHRSQVYTRLDALKQRNPELVPYKRGRKAYINSYMLQCLDGMAALLQQGQTTDEAADQVLGTIKSAPDSRADSPVDTRQVGSSSLAIAEPEQLNEPSFDFSNLLEMLRGLQELADKGWWLSTSQLAQVMGLKSLPAGENFERYGFRFTRSGKNGLETAWKVEKMT
ncbi:MAG: hypothetical protein AAFZ17_01470 [Cyanobacteria bacterium J06650_10]